MHEDELHLPEQSKTPIFVLFNFKLGCKRQREIIHNIPDTVSPTKPRVCIAWTVLCHPVKEENQSISRKPLEVLISNL